MFSLQSIEIAHFLLAMGCLLALALLLRYISEYFFIPRVIGEISAGLVLGPTILGYFFPDIFQRMFLGFKGEGELFGLIYQFGLLLLMFNSGLQFQKKFSKEDIKITSALVVGATIPAFIAGWVAANILDITPFLGSANNPLALKIVIAISIAVTSIPVISKIFIDLGIINTQFAKIVIACAGVHDIILWVTLGFATSLINQEHTFTIAASIKSIFLSISFIAGTLLLGHFMLRRVTFLKKNLLFKASNLGYFLFLMFMLAALAGYLHVETIFGALIAGIIIKLAIPKSLLDEIEQGISNISFSWFIPLYFSIVGLQLNLVNHFNFLLFFKYLLFATIIQTIAVYITARLIKQDRLTSLNLGIAINNRGGPGIVLSSVAYNTGIINQEFFSILVMLALVTSLLSGIWFKFIIHKGWTLMPGDENAAYKGMAVNKQLK